jgi:peptidoglycan-associated lipoprotein
MTRYLPKLPLLALVLLAAACAPKKPPATMEAPPASARPETPAAAPMDRPATVETGASSILPGSQDDLRGQAGGDTVLFAYDSYELDGEARATLLKHATWLRANPNVRVTLEGHCDERGTREYNLALGDRRANSAKNFLATQGIDVARLSTISYGKEKPAVDGADEAAYARNRRAVTMVMSR